ncbi:MAG: aminopeptidase P family protein [Candidatus Wallbacteria bacterium]|nr:aminopeptidase P family protein [Candidatus Wallbacteria bacterium]
MSLQTRISSLQKIVRENGYDGFLIYSPENLFYLTSFYATEYGYLLVTEKKVFLLTNFIYKEQALDCFKKIKGEIVDCKGKCIEFLRENLKKNGKYYIEGVIPHYIYKSLSSELIGIKLDSNVEILKKMRMIKEKDEIKSITEAIELTEKGFDYIRKVIKPGLSELEIKAELEYFLARHGAEKMSFDSIIAAGKNSAYPHAKTGNGKVKKGDFLKMDFGIFQGHYCSDMTRTVGIGSLNRKQLEIYHVVLEAQLAAMDGIRPGMKGREAHELAGNVIARAGYGDYFGHGLGHGVGLEVHEGPRLSAMSEDELKPGMVVTVEPGIYLPGLGGVRIEDIVVIEKKGCRSLNHACKELVLL